MRASQAAADARAATLGDVQLVLAGEVVLAYIQLRSAQARLTIAADNLTSQVQTLQLTQWRAQAGLVSALEVEQARGAVAQTRARLPALQTSIDQTRHALAVLTGQAPACCSATSRRAAPRAWTRSTRCAMNERRSRARSVHVVRCRTATTPASAAVCWARRRCLATLRHRNSTNLKGQR